jgi:hypothetical protein
MTGFKCFWFFMMGACLNSLLLSMVFIIERKSSDLAGYILFYITGVDSALVGMIGFLIAQRIIPSKKKPKMQLKEDTLPTFDLSQLQVKEDEAPERISLPKYNGNVDLT